jgi:hypothetical protein
MSAIGLIWCVIVALGAAVGADAGQPVAGLIVGLLAACGLVEVLYRLNK